MATTRRPIELDEDPIEALYREVQEETGLEQNDIQISELVQDERTRSKSNKVLPL